MIVTLLTDYGRDDEFVGVCHGVIAAIRPDARDRRHHPRDRRATPCAGRARAAQHAAVHAGRACTWRSWIPQVGTERRAIALRTGDGRILVGPGQRAAEPGVGALRGRRPGGGHHALAAPARAGVGHLPRPRHVRPGGAPGSPAARELADAGDPLDPDDARDAWSCRSRASEDGAVVAHALCDRPLRQRRRSNVDHERLAGTGITLGGRVEVEAHGERYVATVRPDVRRRASRASCSCTRTPTGRSRWRSTAATPPATLGAEAGRRGAAAAAMIGAPAGAPPRSTDSTNERAKRARRWRARRTARS